MQFTTFALAALAGIAGVEAQVKTIQVLVGGNGTLTFSPNNIKAAVGDAVQFQFMAGNHTVTQSVFDKPCEPAHNFNANITGIHSGFVPAAASVAQGQIPTWTVMVNNTNPIWLYCAQGRHCQNGMVMVINENTAANASRSLQNYRTAASSVANAGVPGTSTGGTPSSGTGSGDGAGATTTAPATAGGAMLYAPSAVSIFGVIASLFFL